MPMWCIASYSPHSRGGGGVTMLGAQARGNHRKAPAMVSMALRHISPVGPPEVVICPRPLACPLFGHSHLPIVLGLAKPHKPSHHGPHSHSAKAW